MSTGVRTYTHWRTGTNKHRRAHTQPLLHLLRYTSDAEPRLLRGFISFFKLAGGPSLFSATAYMHYVYIHIYIHTSHSIEGILKAMQVSIDITRTNNTIM